MSWRLFDVAVDGDQPARGGAGGPAGAASPAAALIDAPVVTWPVRLMAGDGRTATLAEALGRGGDRVESLLGALAGRPWQLDLSEVTRLAGATPAGEVTLPVEVVDLAGGVAASASVDRSWLAVVELERARPRSELRRQGRTAELEAALHVAMLLGTQLLLPAGDGDLAQVASGAMLWMLGGAVAWALLANGGDPFCAWGDLVSHRWWPVGPSGATLVVARPAWT